MQNADGKWEWRLRVLECTARTADVWHVLCGECDGIPEAARGDGRNAIRTSLQKGLKAVMREKKRKGGPRVYGLEQVAEAITHAQRALAKKSAAPQYEREALRKWLAGDLPPVRGEERCGQTLGKHVGAHVKAAQAGASAMQQAWTEAGKEERGRRAEREGGREGRNWKGVGLSAWRQTMNAVSASEEEVTWEQRGGWTMAAALIWYQRRKGEQRREREEKENDVHSGRGEHTEDAEGEGVVVFDVETTELIDDGVAIEDMEASVACAMWLPAARDASEARAGNEEITCWHERVTRTPGGNAPTHMRELLRWFDRAREIVAYNGRRFDMEVMRREYGGDMDRWRRHVAKLRDPMEAVQREHGRRLRLSTLLRMNVKQSKQGAGGDAPRMWREGKWRGLEVYCRQDVRVLAALVLQATVRLPGRGSTAGMSVLGGIQREWSVQQQREEERNEKNEHDKRTRARIECTEEAEDTERERAETEKEAEGRPKRTRHEPVRGYDEVRRRQQRRRPEAVPYVERAAVGYTHAGSKRKAIVMSPVTLTRTVDDRYEWRDAALRKRLTYGNGE